MTWAVSSGLLLLTALGGWFFWRWRDLHHPVRETLRNVAALLRLENAHYKNYPTPMMLGDFFGFHLTLEGHSKKAKSARKKGYCFLAAVEIPHPLKMRTFILHEQRKTSLKPIAELKWVHTPLEAFDKEFLLLSDNTKKAEMIFREYLCGKILSLSEMDWQLDISGKEAHFEVWQSHLSPKSLAALIEVIVETANLMTVA